MSKFKEDSHPLVGLDQVIHSQGRLMVLTYLYVVDRADYKFLQNLTGLTWGNLATHIGKLEEAEYVEVEKKFVGKKPHSMVKMTSEGREAFKKYKQQMQDVLNNLPD
jgi:DNA-binding MarR family transcriptional regulator